MTTTRKRGRPLSPPVPGSLGEQIRAARLARGLTVVALAEAVGADPKTVWSWESRGAAPQKHSHVVGLREVLGVVL